MCAGGKKCGKAQVVSAPLLAFAVLAAGTGAPCFSSAGAGLSLGKTKAQAAAPGSGSKPVLLKSRSPCLIKPSSSRLWRSKCLPRALTQEALEGLFCVVVLCVKHKLFVLGDPAHQKLMMSLSCEFSSSHTIGRCASAKQKKGLISRDCKHT